MYLAKKDKSFKFQATWAYCKVIRTELFSQV